MDHVDCVDDGDGHGGVDNKDEHHDDEYRMLQIRTNEKA